MASYAVYKTYKKGASKKVIIVFPKEELAKAYLSLLPRDTSEECFVEPIDGLKFDGSELFKDKRRVYGVYLLSDDKEMEIARFSEMVFANALVSMLQEKGGGTYRSKNIKGIYRSTAGSFSDGGSIRGALDEIRSPVRDLEAGWIGQFIGGWEVIEARRVGRKGSDWLCRCVCGEERVWSFRHLKAMFQKTGDHPTKKCRGHNKPLTHPTIGRVCGHPLYYRMIKFRAKFEPVFEDVGELISHVEQLIGYDSYIQGSSRYRLRIVDPKKGLSPGNLYFYDNVTRHPVQRYKTVPGKDLTGQRFGKLTALRRSHMKVDKYYWECECDCGELKLIRRDLLTRGEIKSCGSTKCRVHARV